MSAPCGPNRGSELLKDWRGERRQEEVIELLDLDPASYSRFENGVRRPPAEVMVNIETITRGAVPAKSWFQAARKKAG